MPFSIQGGGEMKKKTNEKAATKRKKPSVISYRMKHKRTANGLSHYVPAEKKALV